MTRTLSFLMIAATVSSARADELGMTAAPPPISLPWGLRPVVPSTVARVDTAVGTFVDAGARGETFASILSISYLVAPTIAPLVRVAVIDNVPATGAGAAAISNPIVGAMWGPRIGAPWKLGVFGGLALPLGSGGGNTADPAQSAAEKATASVRSSMDNAMFAVNDLTPIVGIDVAYVRGGATVQAEATLFELVRVRGEAVDKDASKTNLTSGVHAGYYLLPWLCGSAELRYQRYLSTPAAVAMNSANRDNLTFAVGVRAVWKLDRTRVLRPGVSYARGLLDAMTARDYQIVQVDLPFSF
jgi:hypothetical protein